MWKRRWRGGGGAEERRRTGVVGEAEDRCGRRGGGQVGKERLEERQGRGGVETWEKGRGEVEEGQRRGIREGRRRGRG
ncbi:hypothetical protein NHX12_030098 [Muraenolepis orangiensis]|uniref:Uncharacterized protein n=1 Tax=Muraenolepis orangiensis TaxID=630683 RepID=A0A9Q0E966_9TELE|nr:hypothetical protein NHX12_030098 [Muraenolepis orangiensis]